MATANILDFNTALHARRDSDALEQAEIAAGWFFNEATKIAKAEYDAALQVALGMRGHKWEVARKAALEKFRADTAVARKLFDETVECFLSQGEISDELDDRWTALCVEQAMQEAAE